MPAQTQVLHLRGLNPGVAAAMETAAASQVTMAAGRSSAPLAAHAARGSTAAAAATADADGEALLLAGVSSFAFMGTNAHVVITSPAPPAVAATAASGSTATASAAAAGEREQQPQQQQAAVLWQRQSHWAGPAEPHLLAVRALQQATRATAAAAPAVSRSHVVTLAGDLSHPRLAHLWDHVVGGRHVLPGAAYMEMAVAAARAALLLPQQPAAAASGSGVGSGSGSAGDGMAAAALLAITDATIPAPLILPPLQASQLTSKLAPALHCAIDCVTGRLLVYTRSKGSGGGSTVVHMRATVSAALAMAVATAAPAAAQAPAQASANPDLLASLLAALQLRPYVAGIVAPTASNAGGGGAAEPAAAVATATLLQPHNADDAAAAARTALQSEGQAAGVGLLDCFLQLGQVRGVLTAAGGLR